MRQTYYRDEAETQLEVAYERELDKKNVPTHAFSPANIATRAVPGRLNPFAAYEASLDALLHHLESDQHTSVEETVDLFGVEEQLRGAPHRQSTTAPSWMAWNSLNEYEIALDSLLEDDQHSCIEAAGPSTQSHNTMSDTEELRKLQQDIARLEAEEMEQNLEDNLDRMLILH